MTVRETQEHAAAKERLARCLAAGREVSISGVCPGCRRSPSGHWEVPRWSSVEIERTVGVRRVDVALIDEAGAVVAAVEVRRSSAVCAAKAADLAALRLPWIEVLTEHALKWDGLHALWTTAADPRSRRLLSVNCHYCVFRRAQESAL